MTDRGYARISLATKRSGSLSKQRGQIRKHAGDGVKFYSDESVSGSIPFASRPGGASLLADLRQGDRVLVTKVDRCSRSVSDLLSVVETIEQRGASIVFVEQGIDTAGPMGKFILTLLGALAEMERSLISERRRESLEAFKTEGRHAVGKAPVGLISVPNPNGKGLVLRPDPEKAPLVVAAIDRVLNGESQESVRHSLGLSKTGMHSLVHNPRLAGMTPDGEGVVTRDGIPVVDTEQALIPMSKWRELQDFLEKPTKTWSKANGYGGALICSECGQRMYYGANKQNPAYSTYKCRKNLHKPGQASVSVIAANAEEHVENAFLEKFGTLPVVTSYWSDSSDAQIEAVSIAQVRLDEAKRRMTDADTEEEEEACYKAFREAKAALKKARAMPTERVYKTEIAGYTVADAWERANDDDRTAMLKLAGTWMVNPGRNLSISEKVTLEVDDLLEELLTAPIGEGDKALQGFLMSANLLGHDER